MNDKHFFLSSLDSTILELTRECIFQKKIIFNTGKEAIYASISPSLQIQYDGTWINSENVVLSARHEGYGLNNIKKYPCFVYVTIPKKGVIVLETVSKDELIQIGVGEIYRTEDDAKNHIFDK